MADVVPDPVKKCVAVLKATKSDTEKFAALFMVTKIVKSNCNVASKKLLLESIGFKFLKRLLLSSDVDTDCPPMMYKSVALTVISSFCSEPEIAVHPEIISNIPVFLEIVSNADDDDLDDNLMLIGEAYNCLQNIAFTDEGQKALLQLGAVEKMCEVYAHQSFQTDKALIILGTLTNRFGPTCWDQNVKPFHSIVSKIALDFETDHSERKFELAGILHSLLMSCRKDEVVNSLSDETWPLSIYTGLSDVLTSKIGKSQRDPALKLVSVMLEICGAEWALTDEEKPKQFFLLLVQLCSIEVRMQLENKTIKQILGQAELITSCFISLEVAIGFVALDTLDLEQREKQSLYTALKGAFTAVITTLAMFQKEYEKKKELPVAEKLFAIAMVRVLGAWLAQETSASRNAVYAVFPFMLSLANETFYASREKRIRERLQAEAAKAGGDMAGEADPTGSVDVLRFILPALCHLTVEANSRKIMLETKEEDIFFEALAYHWTNVLLKPPKIPKAERLKMKNIPEHQFTPRQLEDQKDSRAAMISLCNIFMNLTVMEPKLAEEGQTFSTLLKFIFSKLPELRNMPENLVLSGNLAVLGLLLLKQQSKKVEKDDFAICRFIQSVIRFLWDAYCIDESVDASALCVSIRYKESWSELMELWFLGMQTMSAVLALIPWVSDFAMESGWAQGIITMLKQVQKVLTNKYGIPPNEADSITQNFLTTFRSHQEEEGYSLDEWRCALWERALGSSYQTLAVEIYEHWLELRFRYLQPKEEVLSMLRCLKTRYYLALITNGHSRTQWEKLQRLHLEGYFHCILVSGDLSWMKPNKCIFLLACEHLQTPPNECIMIGDRLNTDIIGAENAGLGASIWIPLDETNTDDVDVTPDATIPDVLLLPALLSPAKLRPNLSRYLDLSEPESENSNSSES